MTVHCVWPPLASIVVWGRKKVGLREIEKLSVVESILELMIFSYFYGAFKIDFFGMMQKVLNQNMHISYKI